MRAATAVSPVNLNAVKMKKLLTRSLSGIVYVALIVGAILGDPVWFTVLMSLFSAIAVLEFRKLVMPPAGSIVQKAIAATDLLTAAALPLVSLGFTYTEALSERNFSIITAFIIVIFAAYPLLRFTLALYDRSERPFAMAARSVMSIFYISIPLTLASIINIASSAFSWLSMMMFIMIWLNDTGAFCTGCTMGRHKMFERLSPKKTWEGFWGGFAACVVAGALCPLVIYPSVPGAPVFIIWAVYGAIVSGAATVGDLFESLIKRTVGVKDSGNLIPGHGGLLDRIDSLLAVAPLTMLLAIILVGACNIHALSGV